MVRSVERQIEMVTGIGRLNVFSFARCWIESYTVELIVGVGEGGRFTVGAEVREADAFYFGLDGLVDFRHLLCGSFPYSAGS
jgi:hypothetical protein